MVNSQFKIAAAVSAGENFVFRRVHRARAAGRSTQQPKCSVWYRTGRTLLQPVACCFHHQIRIRAQLGASEAVESLALRRRVKEEGRGRCRERQAARFQPCQRVSARTSSRHASPAPYSAWQRFSPLNTTPGKGGVFACLSTDTPAQHNTTHSDTRREAAVSTGQRQKY